VETQDIVDKDEKVWVKVIEVSPDGQKISLSMKYVSQGDGRDLDPNGVALEGDKARKAPRPREREPIAIKDAVLNVTCVKCGGKGHFAQDCWNRKGGTQYDLIEDSDMPPALAPQRQEPDFGTGANSAPLGVGAEERRMRRYVEEQMLRDKLAKKEKKLMKKMKKKEKKDHKDKKKKSKKQKH